MSIAAQATQVYESELKARLEAEHPDKFVAIEPVSKSFFVADSFIDAALAAKKAHPARKSFVIRIGHDAAFHIRADAWQMERWMKKAERYWTFPSAIS